MQVASQQVTPGENFNIFYFVRNHTDGATYYIQAKIYALDTQELLGTHSLSQSPLNSRLYYKTVTAPGDQAGYGRDIVSIATVYTDSGYTTKSGDYEEQEQYFLVKPLPFVGGGGGISARDAREIFREELKTALDGLPKPEKLQVPDTPDMSFVDALFGALGALQRELNRVPKETTDTKPVLQRIEELQQAIGQRPKFERTDLTALAELAETTLQALRDLSGEMKAGNGQLVQSLEAALSQFKDEITSSVGDKVEETIHSQELTIPLTMNVKNPKKKEEAAAPDVRHLTG
jgi:hypothetical protein